MTKIYASSDKNVSKREKDHMELARSAAGECMVLLDNDGVLPIRHKGYIALYGNGARNTIKGGTGSGEVNSRMSVNIEQGLINAGYTVTTGNWLDRQDEHYKKSKKEYLKWVPEYARKQNITEFLVSFSHPFQVPFPCDITDRDIQASDTDTAVYVIARTSGEGADRYNKRGDYLLYEEEKEQLLLLAKTYKNLILVLNIGGVIDLSEVKDIEGINAVLLMTQLGNVGGDALADVISGKVNPSGKLSDTWAKSYADYPSSEGFSHNDSTVDDEYYTEGIYVGYRYFDTVKKEVLYPFGYGKSYTEFEIHATKVTVEKGIVNIKASVKNVGSVAGKEVLEVYYSAPLDDIQKPYQELAAFKKTKLLQPGDTGNYELSFAVKDMASYSEKDAAFVLSKGSYVTRLGNSSDNTSPVAVIDIREDIKSTECKNLFRDKDSFEEITIPGTGEAEVLLNGIGADVPHINVSASDIDTEKITYQGKRELFSTDKKELLTADHVKRGDCSVEELVAQLSVEEMADLCVGTLRSADASVIGNASYVVPGAAGDTTSSLKKKRGIKNLILADGPAGLRLQPVFKTDKEGNLLPGGAVLGDMFAPFDPKYTDDNSDTYYQYCTAIPIGWGLAQSWNEELLFDIGSMVGMEMEEFGVDIWLAPALNIHRNPLCGRNFEYYSEDPLLSGKTAAAITKGVQSHEGRGVCIKHFAANNQEDNRYFTNSHISERAIREIYLKGFEICVKQSKPASIMTSYNLLNGVHTANSHDLLQAVCRDEWGYKGFIMTDWFTSQNQPGFTGTRKTPYPISASTGCIYAGNDVQMPGCQENVDDIVRAIKEGKEIDGFLITICDLQQCAANMIRAAIG